MAAAYKGQWTKAKHNAAARKAGQAKKRYKGLDTPLKFVSPTLTYQNGKDYRFKVNQQVSILTLDGRVVVSYQGYNEHIDDANRPNKGLRFCCVNCRYTLHADLIGARNIVMRTLLVRHDWVRTGQLSVAPGPCSQGPDVSVVEAKAARLRRYAELRWRPETSPWSKDQGVS